MFTPSALSRNVIGAASCSAVATGGMRFRNAARRPLPNSDGFAGIGIAVATPPGATAFTRIPCGPYMKAALRVRPMTACFDTVYAVPEALPRNRPRKPRSRSNRDQPPALSGAQPC